MPASRGRAHHRRAGGHGDGHAVDLDARRWPRRRRAGVPKSGSLSSAHGVHLRARAGVRDSGRVVEVLGEVLERAAHRHRASARPSRTASRRSSARTGRRAARGSSCRSSPATIRSIISTPRTDADPARRALAARLLGAELHREPGLRGHVDGVVEHHDAAVADHRAGRGERLVVHRQVELLDREVGAERAADLDGAHRPAGARAAAVAVDQLAERDPERASRRCRRARCCRPSWNTWVPQRAADAERRVGLRAVGQDRRAPRPA